MFCLPKTEEDIDNLTDINAQDNMFGQTYLHIFVQSNSPLLDYFLGKHPNMNIQNKDGKTPIFYAKENEIVSKLIKYGASISIKDLDGKNVNKTNPHIMSNFIKIYTNKLKNT